MFMKWRVRSVPAFPRAAVRSLVCGRGGHFTRGKSPDGPAMPGWTLTRLAGLLQRALAPKWGNGGRQGGDQKDLAPSIATPHRNRKAKVRKGCSRGDGGVGKEAANPAKTGDKLGDQGGIISFPIDTERRKSMKRKNDSTTPTPAITCCIGSSSLRCGGDKERNPVSPRICAPFFIFPF
ncbi:hypothetical protein CDAR_240611 [Caerostris darwini]|uniref:Uncharacterized protein n=1 Tax=Caerostris darwini TaxID=1538125 RepID=A0AAV4PRM1_9ARAC|nr:hypothetical protein CDAR_240611 [Caerostris darwini]